MYERLAKLYFLPEFGCLDTQHFYFNAYFHDRFTMFLSPDNALSLLELYKYYIIFPIAIFEGPIIIIISGFLVYLDVLNPYIAFIVLLVADMIGDSLYYLTGKYWRRSPRIKKFANYFGYSEKSEVYLEKHFERHKIKTFLLAKVSHGLGGSVQIAAGIARVSYKEFLFYSLIGTMPKTVLLMSIGFYLGDSYKTIDSYLNMIALVIIGLVCMAVFYKVTNTYIQNFFKKDDELGNQ